MEMIYCSYFLSLPKKNTVLDSQKVSANIQSNLIIFQAILKIQIDPLFLSWNLKNRINLSIICFWHPSLIGELNPINLMHFNRKMRTIEPMESVQTLLIYWLWHTFEWRFDILARFQSLSWLSFRTETEGPDRHLFPKEVGKPAGMLK